MHICGFEKFSMVDYDGYIACTVFTKGCNFRCPFCHNGTLALGDAAEISTDEVMDYLKKRKGLVDAVCITGGEPTLQKDLRQFIVEVKNLGYKVKLDTNGTSPDLLQCLIDEGLLDYVAMDIKSDFATYPLVAGISNTALLADVKRSVEILKKGKVDYEFRTTMMKEYHTREVFEAMLPIISGAKRYFIQKYSDTETCLQHGFHALEQPEAEQFLQMAAEVVGKAGMRGY